jgi:phosphonate transport system substrate-binding protein
MNRRLIIAAVCALIVAACGGKKAAVEGPPAELHFGVLTTESAADLQAKWEPILADMSKAIGIPVKGSYLTNYTALVEAMRFKQVDFGWFSNLPGLEAVRRADGEVFAHTTDPSGVPGYFSIIIVPASSKTTLEDLLKCDKSLNFGMGDVKSTSGTLAPKTYLFAPRGIKPEECFKTVKTSNHQSNLNAVRNGVLDAATNNSSSMLREKIRDPRAADKIRVIWQSPSLPEDPIIWRKDLDAGTREKIRQFFMTYGHGEGPEADRQRALLATLTIMNFEAADDNHLLPVREMEASEQLEEAKSAGDAAKTATAQKAYDDIHAQRVARDTPAPAAK